MTYAFMMDVPIDTTAYDRIVDGLGPTPPPGLLCHMAVEDGGRLRYIDLWESKEDWVRFQNERLHPVVDSVVGGDAGERPAEPRASRLNVHHHWGAYQAMSTDTALS